MCMSSVGILLDGWNTNIEAYARRFEKGIVKVDAMLALTLELPCKQGSWLSGSLAKDVPQGVAVADTFYPTCFKQIARQSWAHEPSLKTLSIPFGDTTLLPWYRVILRRNHYIMIWQPSNISTFVYHGNVRVSDYTPHDSGQTFPLVIKDEKNFLVAELLLLFFGDVLLWEPLSLMARLDSFQNP
ncbi:hypothetical protein VNO77_18913 [Canavalia gladiata]|uniref:Uncharacterized protein n=1 Tax=Canavalia gladiata TaxID=3824 RepID=A0AAN9LLN6_CANGL